MKKHKRNLEKLKNLKPIKKRERTFESQLRDALWDKHGVKFIKIKPTWKGMPDRLAMGFKNWCLVEMKRNEESPSDAQVIMHDAIYELTGRSVIIIWITTLDAAIDLVVRHLKHARP